MCRGRTDENVEIVLVPPPPNEVVQFLSRCFATSSFTLPVGESDAVAAGEGSLPEVS
jgi:hypothetical protein